MTNPPLDRPAPGDRVTRGPKGKTVYTLVYYFQETTAVIELRPGNRRCVSADSIVTVDSDRK